ncbi:hypothetical protein [Thomasclavelia cocleata]|uniref:hypothetical protein n=1 Tax=Thomasclavelia cocleata TaxID=69824 RepID=UPI0025580023|nr:hypothetical protein [Thomasclavelia cocleata]
MKKFIKRVLFISVLGLIMSGNSIYAADIGIGCKTSRNVAEATIFTPDQDYTMYIKGRYTGSSDRYTYIMRLRDTASINGPVLASGGIDAGKKITDVHYNYQYKLNNTNHYHTYAKYTN